MFLLHLLSMKGWLSSHPYMHGEFPTHVCEEVLSISNEYKYSFLVFKKL